MVLDGVPLLSQGTGEGGLVLQIVRFFTDEEGTTSVEYGLFTALFAVVIVGAVINLGQSLVVGFDILTAAISAAIS